MFANNASSEFGVIEKSTSTKFKSAMENLKVSIAPVGEEFLKVATPIVEFLGKIAEGFNNMSDRSKKIITILVAALGAVGPILLMTFGLLANGLANIVKLFITLREGFLRLTGQSNNLAQQTQFLTEEQAQAAAIAHSLDQSHAKLIQTFNVESASLEGLKNAYTRAYFCVIAAGITDSPGDNIAGIISPAPVGPGTPTTPSLYFFVCLVGKPGRNILGFVAANDTAA